MWNTPDGYSKTAQLEKYVHVLLFIYLCCMLPSCIVMWRSCDPSTHTPSPLHCTQEFDSNAKSDKSFKFKIGKGKVIKVPHATSIHLTTFLINNDLSDLFGVFMHVYIIMHFFPYCHAGLGWGDGWNGQRWQETVDHPSLSRLWLTGITHFL